MTEHSKDQMDAIAELDRVVEEMRSKPIADSARAGDGALAEQFPEDLRGLVERVRAEVAARRSSFVEAAQASPSANTFSDAAVYLPRTYRENLVDFKREFALRELVAHEESDFVRNAYRALLHRDPEPEALAYFRETLNRGMTKLDLLQFMAKSPEGRRVGVKLRGLGFALFMQRLRAVPVVGRAVAVAQYVLSLPWILQRLERQERDLARAEHELRGAMNSLAEFSEHLAHKHLRQSRVAVESIEASLARLDRDKASRGLGMALTGRVAALQDEIVRESARRATREEVTRLASAALDASKESAVRLERGAADTKAIAARLDESIVVANTTAARLEEGRSETKAIAGRLDDYSAIAKETASRLEESIAETKGMAVRLDDYHVAAKGTASRLEQSIADTKAIAGRMDDHHVAAKGTAARLEESIAETRAIAGRLDECFAVAKETALRLDNNFMVSREAGARVEGTFTKEGIEAILSQEDNQLDRFYLEFEASFRGSRETIAERVAVYLPVVKAAKAGTRRSPILDVGCGRGEWLELLKKSGMTARGVDINASMTEECRALGLEVVQEDVLDYLRSLAADSLGAVTGIHIIEHLPFRRLITLLDESLRVLRPGGVAIFETPNPENVIVGSCSFWYDPTHQRPLPPASTRRIVELRGFSQVRIMPLHPFPVEAHFPTDDPGSRDRLNHLFYGPQDYAVVAYKPKLEKPN